MLFSFKYVLRGEQKLPASSLLKAQVQLAEMAISRRLCTSLADLVVHRRSALCWRHLTRNAVYWACSSARIDMLRLLTRAAQLSSPESVGQVIAAVEWWQQASQKTEKAELLVYLRSLQQQLAVTATAVAAASAVAQQSQQQAAVGMCCICLEDVVGAGISCSSSDSSITGSHHMCIGCLDSYVQAEADSSKQRIAAHNGRLCCPGDGCSAVFQHHQLAQLLPQQTFAKLLSAWQACIEQTAMQAAAQQAQQEATAAAVCRARAHVQDSILALKCPRCHAAYSFDGLLWLLLERLRQH
jgi:hypothetical protein